MAIPLGDVSRVNEPSETIDRGKFLFAFFSCLLKYASFPFLISI